MTFLRRVPFLREVALLARRFANAVLDDENAAVEITDTAPKNPTIDVQAVHDGPPAHWLADIAAKAPHLVQNGELRSDAFSNFDLRPPVEEEQPIPNAPAKPKSPPNPEEPTTISAKSEASREVRPEKPVSSIDREQKRLPRDEQPRQTNIPAKRVSVAAVATSKDVPTATTAQKMDRPTIARIVRQEIPTKAAPIAKQTTIKKIWPSQKQSAKTNASPSVIAPHSVYHDDKTTTTVRRTSPFHAPSQFAKGSAFHLTSNDENTVCPETPIRTETSTVGPKSQDSRQTFPSFAPQKDTTSRTGQTFSRASDPWPKKRRAAPNQSHDPTKGSRVSSVVVDRLATKTADTEFVPMTSQSQSKDMSTILLEPDFDPWPVLEPADDFDQTSHRILELECSANRAARLEKEQRGDW